MTHLTLKPSIYYVKNDNYHQLQHFTSFTFETTISLIIGFTSIILIKASRHLNCPFSCCVSISWFSLGKGRRLAKCCLTWPCVEHVLPTHTHYHYHLINLTPMNLINVFKWLSHREIKLNFCYLFTLLIISRGVYNDEKAAVLTGNQNMQW